MAYDSIINLRYARDGVSGATEILGAVRARIPINLVTKRQQAGGSVLPDNVHVSASAPQVIVETESRSKVFGSLAAAVLSTLNTLTLGYLDTSGNRKLTCKWAKLVNISEGTLAPAEEAGRVTNVLLTYQLVRGTAGDVEDLEDAIVDAADA